MSADRRDGHQYDLSMDMISIFFLAWILNSGDAFSDFPSLMSTNASMGTDDFLLLRIYFNIDIILMSQNTFLKYSLNFSAVIIDRSFFDKKTEYRDLLKNINNIILEITREEMNTADIDVHVFRGTKVNNLRGKSAHVGIFKYQLQL